jgi:hypothetical protein
MRPYIFYLYKDDGSLIGTVTREAESDEAAQALSLELLGAHPGCEEMEIWEAPRYVAQRRRKAAGFLGLSPRHVGEKATADARL